MPDRPGMAEVLRDRPRIFFACHRRHVRDDRGAPLSAAQASILDQPDAVDPMTLGQRAEHLGVTPGTAFGDTATIEREVARGA